MNPSRVAILIIVVLAPDAGAQTTSLSRRRATVNSTPANQKDPRNLNPRVGNPTIEKHSLTAVKETPPRTFKVHDLITIIVREQRKYEADGELKTRKKFDIDSKLTAIFKPVAGTLGAGTFSNGTPDVKYKFGGKLQNDAEKDREDRLTTRITGEIIDVKPNGNLVIQAKANTRFDNESSVVTLTGVVRADDVNPDNTILSTQLANKTIDVQNAGAVRDGSRRGWIPRILDFLRPI